jgi:cation:H+ antiporter
VNAESTYASIQLALLSLAGGLAMLSAGGELLVSGSTRLAKRLGMTPLLIGLTVVAFGTSMPEFFVGLIALLQNHPDIMTGNVIGSNIANIGLILGISALLYPLPVNFKTVSKELFLVLAASLILMLMAWYGKGDRWMGLIFVISLLLYTYFSYQAAGRQRKRSADPDNPGPKPAIMASYFTILSFIGGGLVLLAFGSDFFIKGAVDVALFLGVNELIIGLTLAAVGTSLPELASSFAALRHRQSDLLVGNIIGSNLFNLLMVLGFGAIVRPFPLPHSLLMRDLPFMFAFSAVLVPILRTGNLLNRYHGAFFLLAYGGYIWLLT